MQYADWLQLGIGALLGLSAVPHCMVMCSGVASALAMAGGSAVALDRREVLVRSLVSNSGRVLSYATAGAGVGAAGVAAFSWLDASLANIALRWLAALLLSVVGLSLAGVMPAVVLIYPKQMVTRLVGSSACGVRRTRSYSALFLTGAAWGFMPCAMAYSALFYAMISGSPVRGMLTMTGFGLATVAPMVLAAFGVSVAMRYSTTTRLQAIFGLLLAGIGIAGTVNAVHDFGVWCRA